MALSQPALSQSALSQPALSQRVSPYAAQPECTLFSEPQQFNTQQFEGQNQGSDEGSVDRGDVIVIGRQPNRRYQVVVIDHSEATLTRLRTCVLDAYLTRSRAGDYIQVASFRRRRDAETVRRILRRAGYRVRVLYRR